MGLYQLKVDGGLSNIVKNELADVLALALPPIVLISPDQETKCLLLTLQN